MSEVYYYNLSSTDNQILSPKTGVSKLKVKTYQAPETKRDVVFWFNREDAVNPEEIINPGISMRITYFEEVSPNKFVIKDFGNREYNLELLYVE